MKKQLNDGVDHVNVYSKGKTELGRFLSNFAYSPINTEDGRFDSIEGYWYWLGCKDANRDLLRKTFGYGAKALGRELGANDWIEEKLFKEKIKAAIKTKLETNPDMLNRLRSLSLPLTHYYEFNGKRVFVPKASWIIKYLETFKEVE